MDAPAVIQKGMFTSRSDEWRTPPELFEALDAQFGFTLDPCATAENAKCNRFFTKADDGLAQDWAGETVFVNPPYSAVKDWMRKVTDQHRAHDITVVTLTPARTDTRWFHSYALQASALWFLRGRLHNDVHDCSSSPPKNGWI